MRIKTLAAVAVLSNLIISFSPAMAQDGIRRLGDFQNVSVQVTRPIPASVAPTPISAPAVWIKHCLLVTVAGGWRSADGSCTGPEIRAFLAQQGIQTSEPRAYAPVAPSGGITDAERQRRESLAFDEDLRQRKLTFDAQVADTLASRERKRQSSAEKGQLVASLIGDVVSAGTSRLLYGNSYYGRGYSYSSYGRGFYNPNDRRTPGGCYTSRGQFVPC